MLQKFACFFPPQPKSILKLADRVPNNMVVPLTRSVH